MCSPSSILLLLKCHLFQDSADYHARRGAHDTFDAQAFVDFIGALASEAETGKHIYAPSFSHALKDPVHDGIAIAPQHRIVLVEGLYVSLDLHPWRQAGNLLDERWLLEVPETTVRRRIIKRHVETGVAKTEVEAALRANSSDIQSKRAHDRRGCKLTTSDCHRQMDVSSCLRCFHLLVSFSPWKTTLVNTK
jgi:pantothenate kinase